ncbi:unnamed protein product [Dovyalis caffra]|uniref:Secreted protein n=1 Tax=Dovyalis caffra TaxID=77055 RepID=A0AAV1S651_9ROSI|nr:unnamed protein product [Dovyalis caffra]
MNAGYQLCYGWLFSAIVLWFKWEHNFAYPCHQSVKTCEKAGIVLSCLLIKYWALGHTFDALNAIWHGNPRWQPNHYVSALCLQQPLTWIIELLHHKVTCSNFLVTWVCLSERRHILESGGCSHTVQLSKDGGLKNQ